MWKAGSSCKRWEREPTESKSCFGGHYLEIMLKGYSCSRVGGHGGLGTRKEGIDFMHTRSHACMQNVAKAVSNSSLASMKLGLG